MKKKIKEAGSLTVINGNGFVLKLGRDRNKFGNINKHNIPWKCVIMNVRLYSFVWYIIWFPRLKTTYVDTLLKPYFPRLLHNTSTNTTTDKRTRPQFCDPHMKPRQVCSLPAVVSISDIQTNVTHNNECWQNLYASSDYLMANCTGSIGLRLS